jgi:hypothetical protein
MKPTSEELWEALYSIGSDDGSEAKPEAVTRLYELGMVEMGDGKPRLTAYGEKCFVVMESGDGEVPKLDGRPPIDPRD